MIEIVYEKEKQKPEGNEGFFRIPNNIRQIGEASETQKIYIEDYAYTYLCRISSENSSHGKAAVLLGQSNWKNNVSYLFVKSAVVLPDMEVSEEHMAFTKEAWSHVYEKNKEFFPGQEIIGWYLSIPGCSMELHEVICRTHLDHFGGNDKVLMVMEPLEKEEAFYRYEDGRLSRQGGFYIYYEKNEPMQNFLVNQNEKSEQKSEKVEDQAVKTFRKKVESKSEVKKQTKNVSFFRAASVCLTVAVLAVGVLYLNDYHKLKKTETVISKLDEENGKESQAGVTPVNGGVTAENPEKENSGETKDTESSGENTPDKSDNHASDETADSSKEEKVDNDSGTPAESQEQTDTEESQKPDAAHKEETAGTDNSQAASAGHQSYTIQDGDTITSISMKYYGNASKIREICSLNGLSPEDFIFPGQKILLP